MGQLTKKQNRSSRIISYETVSPNLIFSALAI